MQFKFPLESLLKHRERLEDMARKDYLVAQTAVNESLTYVDQMWKEIDQVRARKFELQQQGGHKGEVLSTMEEFIVGHKIRIEREKSRLRELMMIAEEKRELLVEASMERKIIVKLKEKMWQRYKAFVRKKEIKEVDDIVTTRFKRSF